MEVGSAAPGSVELTEKNAYFKVADFLTRQHFTVAVSEKLEEGKPTISAVAADAAFLLLDLAQKVRIVTRSANT